MSAAGPDAGLVHQLTTLLLVPTLGQKFKWRKVHATSATFQSPMVAASVTATATVFQEEETCVTSATAQRPVEVANVMQTATAWVAVAVVAVAAAVPILVTSAMHPYHRVDASVTATAGVWQAPPMVLPEQTDH